MSLCKKPLSPHERKTLHIDARSGGDWGQDLLFAGLVKMLGKARVIDHPYHFKHRERLEFTGNPENDWGLERRTLGHVSDDVHAYPSHYSEEEIREEFCLGNVERIFLDERKETYELYLRLRANFFDIPVVVVAGHDRFWAENPKVVADRYGKNLEAMFIDNWRPEYSDIPRTYVYNWSANFDHYWTRPTRIEKKYDISFQGYSSHPNRAEIVDYIERHWKKHVRLKIDLERTPDTMRSYVRKSEYFLTMAESKVCLNLRGAAENGKTLRFYEIPYVGSAMLTQDSGAVQLFPFQNYTHCVYFKNSKEIDEGINYLLSQDAERERIAKAGHEHLMSYHTVESRIRQIYEVLNGQK